MSPVLLNPITISAFAAVKKDSAIYTRYMIRVPFVNRRYTKGVTLLSKMIYKRITGLHLRAEP